MFDVWSELDCILQLKLYPIILIPQQQNKGLCNNYQEGGAEKLEGGGIT